MTQIARYHSYNRACPKRIRSSLEAVVVIVLLTCLPLMTGCGDEPIVVHDSVLATRGDANAPADSEPKFRMVTAIAEQPAATWFFKLSGPIENVGGIQSKWGEFLGSVRFENDEPTWDLPEGWKSKGIENRSLGGGMNMQIGKVETEDDQLAISVSSLAGGQQLLPNVNRWRGQLGLGPIDAIQLAKDLSEVKTEHLNLKVFDAQGPTLASRMGGGGRAPFASAGKAAGGKSGMPTNHPPVAGQPKGRVPSTEETATLVESDIRFTAPEGWEKGKSSAMVVGRFSKETELGPLELMVMTMRATDEAWQMNVEAWAKQIGLKEKPDVAQVTKLLKVANFDSKKAHLNGPNPQMKDNRSVTVVLIKHKIDDGYVVKLMGSQAAVESNQATLDEFLKSITFVDSTNQK